MSLRTRLTILYTILLVGFLLLFGVAVSLYFNDRVKSQLDTELSQAADIVIANTRVDAAAKLTVASIEVREKLPPDALVQLRDRNNSLVYSNTSFSSLLDPLGARSNKPIIRDASAAGLPLRVLTVPLQVGNRDVGTLQVATSLNLVTDIQAILMSITVAGMLVGSIVAALAVWLSTSQALSALSSATQVALQITKADDLAHRIPYSGPQDDEIGQLINAFNQTLGRLENLFNSQRRFLADVGHELRTPLTVIKGNTSLMRRMSCGDEESLESIESEVDRLTRLVGDLLFLAQAESGKMPMIFKTVELDSLTLEVMSQLSVLASEKLKLRLGDFDQIQVCGDRDKIKQVLLNLIGNAINYTPAGEVIIGVGRAENMARLSISDTGPGIPTEDLPHIFERFYRAEKARTRSKTKGFGLGLSIAFWIVHNHNGRIEVDSKLGVGTTFTVWLPLAEGDCKQLTNINSG